MNAQDFKAKVKARCLEVQEYGYQIKANSYGLVCGKGKFRAANDKRVCPIAACLLNAPSISGGDPVFAAAAYFDVQAEDISAFVRGFDNLSTMYQVPKANYSFYKVGQELRQEILP